MPHEPLVARGDWATVATCTGVRPDGDFARWDPLPDAGGAKVWGFLTLTRASPTAAKRKTHEELKVARILDVVRVGAVLVDVGPPDDRNVCAVALRTRGYIAGVSTYHALNDLIQDAGYAPAGQGRWAKDVPLKMANAIKKAIGELNKECEVADADWARYLCAVEKHVESRKRLIVAMDRGVDCDYGRLCSDYTNRLHYCGEPAADGGVNYPDPPLMTMH